MKLNLFRRIANSPLLLLGVFLGTMFTASVLYSVSEGAYLLDSIYWSVVTATTLGSETTMPLPLTYTSVLAVPRSMARSFENQPRMRLNKACSLLARRGSGTGASLP